VKLTDEERAFIELKTEAVAALGITDEFAAREIVGHVERLINEAQAEMVERCIDEVEKMFLQPCPPTPTSLPTSG